MPLPCFWDKLGATHAIEVMSVYGGKQCVWAAWKDEGVGCLLCFNFQIALDKRVGKPTQARCRVAQCPRAHFKMLIFKKNALLRHEQTARHQKAVAFHATGSVVSILPPVINKDTEMIVAHVRGVPTLIALRRLVSAVQTGHSASAFVGQELITRNSDPTVFEGFSSRESMWAAVGVLAETLRQRWRLSLKTSKLSVASDSAGDVDAVTFKAFYAVKVWHGTFGLAQQHLAQCRTCLRTRVLQHWQRRCLAPSGHSARMRRCSTRSACQ